MKKLMVMVTAALAFVSVVLGGDLWVDQKAANAADTNPGTEAEPFLTIQAAVDAVESDVQTTIKIKPGTYIEGATVGDDGIKSVVLINAKKISLEGVGRRDEIEIVGAPDPTTGGFGPGATRCCQFCGATGWQTLKNLTFRDGWTDNTAVWEGRNSGGGLWVNTANANSDVVRAYDCAFIGNHARLGGGAYGGWYVRCLFRNNQNPSTSGAQLQGAGFYNARAFACVFINNWGINTVRDSEVSSCLFIGNYVAMSNTKAANTIAINSKSKDIDGGTCYNCLDTAAIGSRPVLSPATGDFRLLTTATAAIGQGDSSKKLGVFSNAKIYDADVATDFVGNPFPDSGAIDIGPVQGAVMAAGGFIDIQNNGLYFNGLPSSDGDWIGQDAWPKMHLATVRDTETEKTVRIQLWKESGDNVQQCLFPDMQDGVGLMAPADIAGNYKAVVTKTTNIAKVDPENGPYRTIQAAIDAMGDKDAYIQVAPGTYNSTDGIHTFKDVVGGSMSDSDYLAIRVFLRYPHRIVGAGEGVSFIQGAPDSDTQGNGPKAVCAVFGNNSRGVIQGFTIENSYSFGKSGWNWDHSQESVTQEGQAIGGWGALAKNQELQVQDCAIRNSAGGNRQFASNASFKRCKFIGNTAMNINGCTLWACLFADNVPGGSTSGIGVIGQWTTARNCTVVGDGHQKLLVDSGNANCSHVFNSVFSGGTETYTATELADNLFYAFDKVPASSAGSVGNPYFASASEGDYRMFDRSAGLIRGDYSHFVGKVYWEFSTDMDGNVVEFDANGTCAAGAYLTPVPFRNAVFIDAEKGGVAVTGGSIGGNAVVGETVITVTPADDAERPCYGIAVNGETNLFDKVASYSINAAKAAPGVLVEALYSNRWYVDPEGSDKNCGYYRTKAFRTLKAAMTNPGLLAGDEVHAAEGDYKDETMKIDPADGISRRVVVPANVSLIADADRERTFISGQNATVGADSAGRGADAVACAYVNEGAVIRGFTLRNGRTNTSNSPSWWDGQASGGGGGGAFEDCTITGCAGFESLLQYTTVRRCLIVDNLANISGTGSAGRGTSYYDCIIDHNRGLHAVYAIKTMVNCTVGADFPDGKAVYFFPSDKIQPIVKNNLFLCDSLTPYDYGEGYKPENWANNYAVTGQTQEPAKYHSYGITYVDGLAVKAGTYEPIAGNPVIDALDASEANPAGLDANGNQRVYNGRLDIGAVDFDARPLFAKALSASVVGRYVKVEKAGSAISVQSVSDPLVLHAGDEIVFVPATARVGTGSFKPTVSGSGVLTVLEDGVPLEPGQDGAYSIFSTEGDRRVTLRFDSVSGDAFASIGDLTAERPGLCIIFR